MKKLLLLLAVLLTFGSSICEAKPQKLTPEISWEVTPDGTLLITGTGVLPDAKYDKSKNWLESKYEGQIRKIVISEGITEIGNNNFSSRALYKGNTMISVKEVVLPSTLTQIGPLAFAFSGVQKINFPEGLHGIWFNAFEGCRGLREVTLPKSLVRIFNKAFYDCTNLESVDFGGAAVTLSPQVFGNDAALCRVSNAENVKYDTNSSKPADFANVFEGTQVSSLIPAAENPVADDTAVPPDGNDETETDEDCDLEMAEEEEVDWDNDISNVPAYIVADLNVRTEPSSSAPVLGKLEKYDIICPSVRNKDGSLNSENGYVSMYAPDMIFDDGTECGTNSGFVADKYVRVFDQSSFTMDSPLWDDCMRGLLVPDGSQLFGYMSIERQGDILVGEITVKNQDLIDSGGNGILIYVRFKGDFRFGDIPYFHTLGPVDDEIYGEMLRNGTYYDSKNDVLSVAGMLWK